MLYAISGKKRHGKDTFYTELKAFLETNTALSVKMLKFADPIYEYVEKYFGIPRQFWNDDNFKDRNRYILQGLGECYREEVSDLFWVHKALENYKKESNIVYVVTDLRHPNECEAVLILGGKPLRVDRPDKKSSDTHITEVALDNYENFYHKFTNTTYENYKKEIEKWAIKEFSDYLLRNH